MNITGANKIELLKKGKKQILLIGDYHYHYKIDYILISHNHYLG
mgnify:CR=1 FL=1